jgi:hypothetical protein
VRVHKHDAAGMYIRAVQLIATTEQGLPHPECPPTILPASVFIRNEG